MGKDGGIESRAFELQGSRLAGESSAMRLLRSSKSRSSSTEESEAGELGTFETAREFDCNKGEPNDSDNDNVGESKHDECDREDDVDALEGSGESVVQLSGRDPENRLESENGKVLFKRTQGSGSRTFEDSRSDTIVGDGEDGNGSEYIERISSK